MRYIGANPDKFQGLDLDLLIRRLQKSGASEYFELVGRTRAGKDIFGFAEPCPKGVRRLKRGFVALMETR